jgi:hypothetical protein
MRPIVAFLLMAGVVFTGVGLAILRSQSPPTGVQACSGGITVLVNNQPLSSGCVLNLLSGPGVIASATPNTAIGGTNLSFTADLAVMQTLANDQAGQDHVLNAISTNCSGCTPGLVYFAALNPALATVNTGSWYIMLPDVPTQPGATLSIGGLGPTPLASQCSTACVLIAVGGPVNSFQVH